MNTHTIFSMPANRTAASNNRIANRPRKVMRNAFIFTLLMIAGAVITANSGMDGMNGGFALISMFIFFGLMAFITTVVYVPRAKAFDKLISELHPLAHWTYTQEEWNAFIKEDLEESITVNKATLKLVVIISLVVGAGLLLIYRDSLIVMIIAGIILLISIVAFIAPRIRSRMLKKGIHEAYVGETSAFVGGTFQTWTQLGAHLTAAAIYDEPAIPILHIIFDFPTLQGMRQEIIRIPVPAGKMEEAKQITTTLQKQVEK